MLGPAERIAPPLFRGKRGFELNLEAFTEYTARTAREELREIQREGLFPTDLNQYATVVDKTKTGHDREFKVSFGGNIMYRVFDAGVDFLPAAMHILQLAFRYSPWAPKNPYDKRAGNFRARHYRNSFALLRNARVVVQPGKTFWTRANRYVRQFANAMQPGETLSLVSLQPYSRKIEEKWSSKAPRGVLRAVYASAKRGAKTKAIFMRKVEYRPAPGELVAALARDQGPVVTYAERRRVKRKWAYTGRLMRKHRVYPVLTFGPPFQGGEAAAFPKTQWTHKPGIYQVLGSGAGTRGTIAEQIRRAGATVVE